MWRKKIVWKDKSELCTGKATVKAFNSGPIAHI